jgi:protein-disulfide isomerase
MGLKALAFGMVAFLAISESTCGKSSADDATKEKPGPDVTLEGVDTNQLTTREKKEWGTYVSEFLSPCSNVPVPIAQCVQEKRDCKRCMPAAKFVLREVKDGMSREQIEKSYKNRFEADKVKNVPLDGSPAKGPDAAAITLVEFADFECPHCGEFAPLLDKLVDHHKAEVRFVFKNYPLAGHPHADIAARAAVAAGEQGKFWEMHHALFANQRHLEQTDLDSYAKELGLDVGRFHADMQSQKTTDRIAKDKKLGEDLQIQGTPSIFVNGRSYDGHQDLDEWIQQDLQGLGAAAPAPSSTPVGASSGAPSASASAPAPKKDAGR